MYRFNCHPVFETMCEVRNLDRLPSAGDKCYAEAYLRRSKILCLTC